MSGSLFGLADPEHLGAAGRAHALGCRSAVLHRYFFGVFHFSLCLAFYAISFHRFSSLKGLRYGPVCSAAGNSNGWVSAIIFVMMKRSNKVENDCCLQFCNFIPKTVNLATIIIQYTRRYNLSYMSPAGSSSSASGVFHSG